MKTISSLVITLVLLTGCSANQPKQKQPAATQSAKLECEQPAPQKVRFYLKPGGSDEKQESLRLEATGYGAPPKEYYPEYQRRLMAMRASRIDAYRALAEMINGVNILGGTTLSDMAIQKDSYRVFINSYVRGARVVSVTERGDGNYETVLSAVVDQDFFTYMLKNRLTYDPGCNPGQDRGLSAGMASDRLAPSSFYYSE